MDQDLRIDFIVNENGKPPKKYTFTAKRGSIPHTAVGGVGDYNGPMEYEDAVKRATKNLIYSSPQLQIWARGVELRIYKYSGEISIPVDASLETWTRFAGVLEYLILNGHVPSSVSNNGPGVNIFFYIPTESMKAVFDAQKAELCRVTGLAQAATDLVRRGDALACSVCRH